MKKSYTKLVMLLLAMVGCMTASAQDNLVELDETMFKAWDSDGAVTEANLLKPEDPENDPNIYYDNHDGNTVQFGCELGYFKNVDGGNVIYGNGNVIWQWYADLTGTKKMYFYGQKGITIRVLYNRPAWYEGCSDSHGAPVNEKKVSIGDDGVGVLDVEALGLEYFHVNCLKIDWGASSLKFKRVMLEGTVPSSGKTYDPMEGVSANYQNDVTSIDLGPNTNLSTLLNGKERLIFPTDCAVAKVNGTPVDLMSVEGMLVNGRARIFLFMNDAVEGENADIKLSFTNPTDDAHKLVFASGRFEDEAVSNITDMVATFEDGVGEFYPNGAKIPNVDSADPEVGSINLPVSQAEFKVKLTGKADMSQLKAKFDGQDMTVSPSTGFADEITLTRTGGDLSVGVHTITLSNMFPEMNWFDEAGEATIKYSFGLVDTSDGIKTYMTDGFEESGNGTVPAAWIVDNDGTPRSGESNLWGGCRLVGVSGSFAPVVLYLCSRGNEGNVGYAYYGMNDKKLTLNPDTIYHLTYEVARWDGSGTRGLKVQVVTEENKDAAGDIISGGDILAEKLTLVNTDRNIAGECNKDDIEFTVQEAGNVVLKFFPCDQNGNAAGWGDALALANIKVQYVPDVMGIELIQTLNEAMEIAKTAKTNAEGERYAGEKFNTLDGLITKYTNTPPTAPSTFDAVAKELKDAATAMDSHRTLCDDFDKLPAQLLTNIDKYAESKFAGQPIFADLQAAFDKYATVEEEQIEVEGVMQTQRVAKPKNITDDAELQAGINEMTAANANVAMFSEGKSSNGTMGYAALHERLRAGVETAAVLGLDDSNAAVAAANAELGDNDAVAKKLQSEITKKLYANIVENGSISEPIDMTVFIKNPNLYVTKASNTDMSADMAPGWAINITSSSYTANWGTSGGGGHVATDVVPADEALTIEGEATVTQQITNLPAGIYTVTAYLGDRRGNSDFINAAGVEGETDEEKLEAAKAKVYPMEYLFINTSATEEGQFDNKTPVASNGTSWGTTDNNRIVSQEFTVTDGKITLGVKDEGSPAWFAFNDIRLTFVAPAPGFNYSAIKGDVNGDNQITMNDANQIVNYFLATDKDPNFPVEAADMNGDGSVTMNDANAVVNIFLSK